jgi:hypothetical protein
VLLRSLVHAVVTRGICGQLAGPVVGLILDRIRDINQRFARLAARLRDGHSVPRHGFRRSSSDRKPRRHNPLPHTFGWLLPLVPDAVQSRGQLEHTLQTPEMVALIAEAPASMARILRPLCWMLHLTPPPILARPRPRVESEPPEPEPPEPTPPAPAAAPPTPSRAPSPGNRPVRSAPLAPRVCGPPRPA